ncbi:hypothetical protein I5M27_15050 [Adhaeribacter sp. BT258]|uniref:Antitoxin component YwqK of the YwqJK toxin-antitoxin module n=1 Tax=Adhaeribacter terrigena TaxID=2793070 RepID=A0ABS1C6J3_9BACT|nr:hypothetical protein [Adhaeribacter terrigena]MBK0404313.1 hypothetical protein [Adhaeribacter terrigena]
MTKLILIYFGLFAIIWLLFKISKKQSDPFKNRFFWSTFLLSFIGLTAYFFFSFTRNFFGTPPKDGWNRTYYEDGKLLTEFFASDGKIEGFYKNYYPNGQLWLLSKYKNGVEIDTSFAFYETGEISSFEVFKDNKSICEINYSPTGIKKSERHNPISSLQPNHNITYYPNGKKEFESIIDNKTFEGKGIYYYPNGVVKFQGQYKKGNKSGVWFYFDSVNGNILDTDTFSLKTDRDFKTSWL